LVKVFENKSKVEEKRDVSKPSLKITSARPAKKQQKRHKKSRTCWRVVMEKLYSGQVEHPGRMRREKKQKSATSGKKPNHQKRNDRHSKKASSGIRVGEQKPAGEKCSSSKEKLK